MHKPVLWDKETLDAHEQEASEEAESARSEQDWQRATIYIERAVAEKRRRFVSCALPACRRARRCRGNPTLCLPPDACESPRLQDAIEHIYVKMQDQRRAATYDGRKLDWLDPVTRKRPRKPVPRRPGEGRDP
ncbi:MAG: hypothetical protein QOH32_3515 [Bradyrhizobium sp.]|jgi:hypothetical protein|nr:hypothetical protein [Bradyrhizobium sp.]